MTLKLTTTKCYLEPKNMEEIFFEYQTTIDILRLVKPDEFGIHIQNDNAARNFLRDFGDFHFLAGKF
jgi:hypothetical protein